MSTPATLETEAIVNHLHVKIITKNRSQIEFASNELQDLKRLEDRRPTRMIEKLTTRLRKPTRNDDNDKKRAELEEIIRDAEAQLRQAQILQNQVHMISDMIIVALTAKQKVKEDDEMMPRIDTMIKTLTSSALAKEIEGARGALEMKSLEEVAKGRAKTVDAATARSAFLKVERKWEAMKALREWEGVL